MQTSGETGFYGKLPCRGDFLQRRAPNEFVEVWDAWLQSSIHSSKEALQDEWLERYLTGPIWRFALSAGACGAGAYAGVLVPSVDRVGRYFPLTIVAQLTDGRCPLDVACSSTPWFEAAEALALDALAAETLDIDEFDEHVAQLGQPISVEAASESSSLANALHASPFPAQAANWRVPLGAANSLQRAVNALAWRELSRSLHPAAVWWTDGSNAVGASWLSTQGLPEGRAFTAMLSGDWAGSNWSSLDSESQRPVPGPQSLLHE